MSRKKIHCETSAVVGLTETCEAKPDNGDNYEANTIFTWPVNGEYGAFLNLLHQIHYSRPVTQHGSAVSRPIVKPCDNKDTKAQFLRSMERGQICVYAENI